MTKPKRRSVLTNGLHFHAMVPFESDHAAQEDFSRSTDHGKRSSETWMTTEAMAEALAAHVQTSPTAGRCATKALRAWETRKRFLERSLYLAGG